MTGNILVVVEFQKLEKIWCILVSNCFISDSLFVSRLVCKLPLAKLCLACFGFYKLCLGYRKLVNTVVYLKPPANNI